MDRVSIVRAWHGAVNAGEVERAASLCTDDVEVGGPRGSGRGVALLRDWVAGAGIQLTPVRWYERSGTLVVEQRAEWRSAETGEITGAQDVASIFEVVDGRVARVIRYPDLSGALQAAGLSTADRVAGPDGAFPA